MARAALRLLVDLAVFALAASGAAAAFGVAGAFAVFRSALPGAQPDNGLVRVWCQARRVLAFLYNHSGLPQAFSPVFCAIYRIVRRTPR